MSELAMLTRVHRETASYHCVADKHRFAIWKLPTTEANYRGYLARIFGFESPVESALQDLANLIDLRARNQITRLRADLCALDEREPSIAQCRDVAVLRNAPEALGWAYVIERNTLLHGVIERLLRIRMCETMKLAGTYLAAAEHSSTERWGVLGAAMDRIGTSAAITDRIVAGAIAAFRAQRGWYGSS
jgi:heme oxygenase